jgi:hypothetical protein
MISQSDLEKRIQLEEKELKKYLNEVVYTILPEQIFSGASMVGGNFTPRLHTKNKYFQNSKYYYSGDFKFIHYTNLPAFLNIINESCLRLSDYNSLDDPQEFAYAHNQFEFIKSSIESKYLKKCFNCISFCEYDENNAPDSFDMWRLYGKDGGGVAFVFSITNNRDVWENYAMSKVYYGDDEIKDFKELDKRHKAYCDNSPISFSEHLFDNTKNRIPFLLYSLLGFHKVSLYKIENEVRLMRMNDPFDIPFRGDNNYYSINKNLEPANYRKLSINKKDQKDFEPAIKIEKMILGYRFNSNDYEKISEIISNASTFKLDYLIKTELSKLRKYFDNHK